MKGNGNAFQGGKGRKIESRGGKRDAAAGSVLAQSRQPGGVQLDRLEDVVHLAADRIERFGAEQLELQRLGTAFRGDLDHALGRVERLVDRKSGVEGQSGAVSVERGCCGNMKKKKNIR